jgi:nucleotide-binding universal stress UspA family protein
MGTCGEEYAGSMLGSTVQTVVARSPVPVLTIAVDG